MTGKSSGQGTGGTPYDANSYHFPGVPYSSLDFNFNNCPTQSGSIEDYNDPIQVELV